MTTITKSLIIFLLFTVCVLGITPLYGQQQNQAISRPQAARYFLGNQDEILMQVNVWGFVKQPGQYMVPYDTDLISLLSYAGGPVEEAKVKNVKIIRKNADDEKKRVLKIDVKKYLQSGDPSLIPILEPGDSVIVSGTTFHFITKLFEFVWRIALVIQIIFMAEYYSTRS